MQDKIAKAVLSRRTTLLAGTAMIVAAMPAATARPALIRTAANPSRIRSEPLALKSQLVAHNKSADTCSDPNCQSRCPSER